MWGQCLRVEWLFFRMSEQFFKSSQLVSWSRGECNKKIICFCTILCLRCLPYYWSCPHRIWSDIITPYTLYVVAFFLTGGIWKQNDGVWLSFLLSFFLLKAVFSAVVGLGYSSFSSSSWLIGFWPKTVFSRAAQVCRWRLGSDSLPFLGLGHICAGGSAAEVLWGDPGVPPSVHTASNFRHELASLPAGIGSNLNNSSVQLLKEKECAVQCELLKPSPLQSSGVTYQFYSVSAFLLPTFCLKGPNLLLRSYGLHCFWTEVPLKSSFVRLSTSQKRTSGKFAMIHNFK